MLEDKIIINEIIPYLRVGEVGANLEIPLLSIVKSIFYKLKTGCQWKELPVKQFVDRENTTWNAIYYHFRKWCKDGSWAKAYRNIIKKYRQYLDLSCVNLDGSHTRVFCGGESVGYNGRKKYNSTNIIFMVDNQGIILFCSRPISGNHNDLYNIKEHFQDIKKMADEAEIELSYIFLNADSGFDSQEFRQYLESLFITANIDFNKRNGDNTDREEYFDNELYKKRSKCEHPFAWMDAYKALLIRYEKLDETWLSMNIMGMIHIALRKFKKHIKENP